jgi:hypothetical protein
MADVLSRVETVSNSGGTIATFGANNYKHVISQSDAGREFIVSVTADGGTLTDAKLTEAIQYLTRNNYTSSNTDGSTAATIAAIGTSDGTAYAPGTDTVVFLRLQTTDTFSVTDYNANDALGTTLAVVCEFKPAL